MVDTPRTRSRGTGDTSGGTGDTGDAGGQRTRVARDGTGDLDRDENARANRVAARFGDDGQTVLGSAGIDVAQVAGAPLVNLVFSGSGAGGLLQVDTGAGLLQISQDVELLTAGGVELDLSRIRAAAVAGQSLRSGSDGADDLVGTAAGERLLGGLGGDTVAGGGGDDDLIGDWIGESVATASDRLEGGAGNDNAWGQGGDDTIIGGDGDDRLFGNIGDDSLSGGAGNDQIKGHLGSDIVQGDAGNDNLFGGGGNDEVYGGADADTVSGNSGADSVYGGDGDDAVRGHGGPDQLFGGNGNDTLVGHQGFDTLDGGAGNDVLIGGQANDRLIGGPGADVFSFTGEQASDTIVDFETGLDTIVFAGATSFAQIDIASSGTGAVVGFGDAEVTLLGVAAGSLDAADFGF